MNRVTDSHHTEQIGVYSVGVIVHKELNWLFRVQDEDFGIDAQLEVVANRHPTGRIIAAQIKYGRSYFNEEVLEGIVFRGESGHLQYWLDHDLPVIVVLYDSDSNTAFWQRVTVEAVMRLSKGWKMFVPRSQKLDKLHAPMLEEVASRRTRELLQVKAKLAEYRCPYCGALLAERGNLSVGSEHCGQYEIFECGYYALDGYVERPCPLDPKFPPFEDYELEFLFIPSAAGSPWLCIAIPKTDMARKLRIGAGSGHTQDEAKQIVQATYKHYAVKRGA